MDWWIYLVIFSGGLIAGVIADHLAGTLHWKGADAAFGAIGRAVGPPFTRLTGYFRGRRKAKADAKEPGAERIDPREQQISDSAQTIRNILLTLADMIKRTDQAASDSSRALAEIKNGINRSGLPTDLAAAQSLLLTEIDRVISHNTALKSELAGSQAVLNDQRKQIEELKTAVRMDSLTQLANRAYFDEKLEEMIKMRKRYDEPFSIMMIDVDNFKTLNDTYGHQAGDRILKGVAFKMRASLRETDTLARFGGDEFAGIIVKAGANVAIDVAWKVSDSVRGSRLMLDKTEIKVTLSIGVAEARAGESAEDLLKRADSALYQVKKLGRNGVYAEGMKEGGGPARPKKQ